MRISPARVAAYEILLRIERDSAFSSVLLPQYESNLSELDAGLCHEIVLGVLRNKLKIDYRIRSLTANKKLDLEVLTSLRIGAYQIVNLDRIPAHSAVNDSVGLVHRARKVSAKGFVNAVLRRVSSEPELAETGEREIDLSHPEWLLERWERQFDRETAISIAKANNRAAKTSFRRTGKELGGDLSGVRASEIVDGAFVVERLSLPLRRAAENGEIYFQDEASQLIALKVSIPEGGRFLDVCAAPGGKTTLVAIANPSARIVAGDLYQQRVELVRANFVHQGLTPASVLRYDAVDPLPFADGSFDSVLVDAPCSGTGTISGNPEIRYFLRPKDISELSGKQLQILQNASNVLGSGGRLYYSTCSLEREENEDVISAFLANAPDFRVVKGSIEQRFRTSDGFGRTFPHRDGTDGFFFAVLERK